MQGSGFHELPGQAPTGIPSEAWDAWREAVRGEAKPLYEGFFEYELSEVRLLPEIHYLTLSSSGRDALSRLVLASLGLVHRLGLSCHRQDHGTWLVETHHVTAEVLFDDAGMAR